MNALKSASLISPSKTLTPAILSGCPSRSTYKKSASPQEKELLSLSFGINSYPLPSWMTVAAHAGNAPQCGCPPVLAPRVMKAVISGQEGEPWRQLHQLEHFVNIDVDAAQHHLDGFIVSPAG